ncbi:hypothetical protein G7078_05395 [Sphingomonas sinipercae]|uniref:Uncharacterized protein n=1 Tax=Sphingomonas sinipercae TaxID=2714944 RepID=A0A6G7ZMX8_9SPHN|nr:hypothetical protein [Sphingomonas sinipercae]QIL02278.1 hypothetical protein G7078_05395 [Sphingomonas sinipercae]
MRKDITVMAVLLAAGLAAAPAEATRKPRFVAPEQVEFVRQSWGAVTERWSLNGKSVVWEKPREPAYGGEKVSVYIKRFTLTPLQYDLLMSAVRRAQDAVRLPDECEQYIPDGPYGGVRWTAGSTKGELKFTASCMKGPNADKAAAGFAVGRIVTDAAEKIARTEMRIVD